MQPACHPRNRTCHLCNWADRHPQRAPRGARRPSSSVRPAPADVFTVGLYEAARRWPRAGLQRVPVNRPGRRASACRRRARSRPPSRWTRRRKTRPRRGPPAARTTSWSRRAAAATSSSQATSSSLARRGSFRRTRSRRASRMAFSPGPMGEVMDAVVLVLWQGSHRPCRFSRSPSANSGPDGARVCRRGSGDVGAVGQDVGGNDLHR